MIRNTVKQLKQFSKHNNDFRLKNPILVASKTRIVLRSISEAKTVKIPEDIHIVGLKNNCPIRGNVSLVFDHGITLNKNWPNKSITAPISAFSDEILQKIINEILNKNI